MRKLSKISIIQENCLLAFRSVENSDYHVNQLTFEQHWFFHADYVVTAHFNVSLDWRKRCALAAVNLLVSVINQAW